MRLITASILTLGLLTLPAFAQESGFSLGAHAFAGKPNNTSGLGLDAAFSGVMTKADLAYRIGLGYNTFLKEIDADSKAKLNGMQGYADWYITKPASSLAFFLGLSANKWNITGDAPRTGSVKGVKLGLRLGAEYAISKNLAASAVFQATELGTETEFTKADSNVGKRGINPSWIQVGLRYTF